MPNLEELLQKLESLRFIEDLEFSKLEKTRGDINGIINSIGALIKSGKTFDNPIFDYVFACCRGDDHIWKKLEELNARLKGMTGQLVLCVASKNKGLHMIGPKAKRYQFWPANKRILFMGVLAGEKLGFNLDSGDVCLPVGGKTSWFTVARNSAPELIEAEIGDRMIARRLFDVANLALIPPPQIIFSEEVTIHIGDAEAIEWATREFRANRNNTLLYFFYKMARMLGKKIENAKILGAVRAVREMLLHEAVLTEYNKESSKHIIDPEHILIGQEIKDLFEETKRIYLITKEVEDAHANGQGDDPIIEKMVKFIKDLKT